MGNRLKRTIQLRTLFVLLAFVAIAPGVVVNVYSSMVLQRNKLARAQKELDSVVNLAAANQEQWIDGVRQLLAVVASGPSVRRKDLKSLCTEYLQNVRQKTHVYADIGVLNLDGTIECQSNSGARQVNVMGQRYFRNAVESQAFAVGGYIADSGGIRNAVSFGMPVYDYAGMLMKVAFASLELTHANNQLKSISLPKHLRLYVTDGDGRILVTNDIDPNLVGERVPDRALRTALVNRGVGRFSTTDTAGVVWLHSITPIGGAARGALMVSASEREMDATILANTHFAAQVGITTTAAILGLLLAWLFAHRSLAQPMRRLIDRMQRVEHGNDDSSLASPVASANTELLKLDACFTRMIGKLQHNQHQLIKTQEITRVGFYSLDLRTMIYTASPIALEILGLDTDCEPVTLSDYQAMIHPDDLSNVQHDRELLFSSGKSLRLQYRIIRPDGGVRWLDAFGFVETASDGTPMMYSGAIQDITARMQSEQVARDNENRFRLLFENSLDGVLLTNSDGEIFAANSAACVIFGLTEEQMQGRSLMFEPSDSRLSPFIDQLAMTGSASGELTMLRADGTDFETELSSTVFADGNGNTITSMILRDITERNATEKHIHQLAFFDPLTDLPNRRLLMDRLGSLLTSAQRSGQIAAVLFVDLDYFKNVNDAHGHATGDALLRQVASRLLALMRSEDTVARIGGDEFVILVPRLGTDLLTGARRAMEVAEKVRCTLIEPFFVNDQQFGSGASIGVTLLPKAAQTTGDLLREADTAMYRAKAAGRNQVAFFEAAMLDEVKERLALEHDLAKAIGSAQIAMYLQPQWNHCGQASGCELLMRWTHPTRGAVAPSIFIPLAEETGLILRLGDWVIRQGCLTVLRLQEAGRALSVSVNVSPRQFRQPDFVERVRAILAETGASPTSLIFEVTEGLIIENLDDTILRMNELVGLGIRFSIDDFGTGYSSLGYLSRMPLYELKIDRSFVLDAPGNFQRSAIVQSIVSMAAHMGLHVVAEGVETHEEATFLKLAGCAAMQGYLLARPMPVEDWLEKQRITSA